MGLGMDYITEEMQAECKNHKITIDQRLAL
jgi:hypothetical protein